MELRHLRYFLAVAEEGHFGRAAHKLHIVQPALSMQIRALEEELGGPLFVRSSRRVELTEAGALLKVEALRAVEQADRAKRSVQRAIRGEVGRVRIGFAGNAMFGGKLLDDLRVFHRTCPDVEVELGQMAPRLQAEAIAEGRLDVGYAPALGLVLDPPLVAQQVGSWPWVVALAVDHPLARKQRLSPSLLADQPFILYATHALDDGQATVLRALLGGEPRVAQRAPDTLSVLALVGAGLGITLVPAPLAKLAVPDVVYRAIAGSGPTSDLVLVSRAGETAGAVRRFVALAMTGRDGQA